MDRDEVITRIRKALRERTGRAWSVTGGRGTAWGWIRIDAPPSRRGRDRRGARLAGASRAMRRLIHAIKQTMDGEVVQCA